MLGEQGAGGRLDKQTSGKRLKVERLLYREISQRKGINCDQMEKGNGNTYTISRARGYILFHFVSTPLF